MKTIAVSFYDSQEKPSIHVLQQIRMMVQGIGLKAEIFIATKYAKNLEEYWQIPNSSVHVVPERSFNVDVPMMPAAEQSLQHLLETNYAHWTNSLRIGERLVQGAMYESCFTVTDEFQSRKGLRTALRNTIESNLLFVSDQFNFQYPLIFLPSYQSNVMDVATMYRLACLWKQLDTIDIGPAWANFISRFEHLELNSVDFCEYFGNYVWYFWVINQSVGIRQYKEYWPVRNKI